MNNGINFFEICKILNEFGRIANIFKHLRDISVAVDFCVDGGIMIPFFHIKDDYYDRAYRYGEGSLFPSRFKYAVIKSYLQAAKTFGDLHFDEIGFEKIGLYTFHIKKDKELFDKKLTNYSKINMETINLDTKNLVHGKILTVNPKGPTGLITETIYYHDWVVEEIFD